VIRDLAVLFIHLVVTIARLLGPGGTRSVVAESLLVKHQLMILNRSRTRAPDLRSSDRFIVGFTVHAGALDGPALCRMFNRIVSGSGAPRYLSSDNDPLFLFHQWQVNLRILDVMEVKTVSYVPLSHPFVERLVGTVRREYLDQVPFWSARDLERKLISFQDYYNKDRVHRGLDGAPPNEQSKITDRKIARLHDYRWEKHCRDLYQLPVAA
jgi:hypothetical protein